MNRIIDCDTFILDAMAYTQPLTAHNLSPMVKAYIEGMSGDGWSYKRNQSVFDQWALMPRVLRGTHAPSLNSCYLNTHISAPFLIAPMAYQCMVHPDGERALLNAAQTFLPPAHTAHFPTIMIVSMLSSTPYDQLACHAQIPLWMHMYILKNQYKNEQFIQNAARLGYKALVITVDAPVYGYRTQDIQYPLILPPHLDLKHLEDLGLSYNPHTGDIQHFGHLIDPHIDWDTIENLRQITDLPIILKGILSPDDTCIALSMPHVQGVVISNHGGRQLDGVPTAMDVLDQHRDIANTAVSRTTPFHVFADGAMNTGTAIIKTLARGAHGVLIGRRLLYALVSNGEDGARHVLCTLYESLHHTMTLMGVPTCHDITKDHIMRV